jgi:hypothetical protein
VCVCVCGNVILCHSFETHADFSSLASATQLLGNPPRFALICYEDVDGGIALVAKLIVDRLPTRRCHRCTCYASRGRLGFFLSRGGDHLLPNKALTQSTAFGVFKTMTLLAVLTTIDVIPRWYRINASNLGYLPMLPNSDDATPWAATRRCLKLKLTAKTARILFSPLLHVKEVQSTACQLQVVLVRNIVYIL